MAGLNGTAEMLSQHRFILWSFALFIWAVPSAALDLSKAVVVSPENLSGPERKAVTMLVEEVEKRTQIRWERASTWPSGSAAVVAVGVESELNSLAGEYAEELSRDRKLEGREGY